MSIILKILSAVSLIYRKIKSAIILRQTKAATDQIDQSKGDDDDIQALQKLRDADYGTSHSDQPK